MVCQDPLVYNEWPELCFILFIIQTAALQPLTAKASISVNSRDDIAAGSDYSAHTRSVPRDSNAVEQTELGSRQAHCESCDACDERTNGALAEIGCSECSGCLEDSQETITRTLSSTISTMILPGHGFHQNLLIRLPPISLATQDLLFLFHFPRHTFADRYELARITWPDGLEVQSLGDADLEAGAYMDAARPHMVAVTVHSRLFRDNKISIPFHMRYQPPSTASSLEVPAIRVTGYLITCNGFMMPISKATDLQMTNARYTLSVPVGDVHDSQWVEAATHIVVVSGAIAVLVSICRTDGHLKAASRREKSQ